MSDSSTFSEALDYHQRGRPGKLEIRPTKPTATQADLSLAYSPGVAEPCLEIAKEPLDAFKYTNRGNLVAVESVVQRRADLCADDEGADLYWWCGITCRWRRGRHHY